MYGLKKLREYSTAMLEVLREYPLRSPEILFKMIRARLGVGFGPQTFLLYDLHNQPASTWGDYLPFDTKVGTLLRMINRVDEYRRYTEDKLLATEVLQEAGVPAAEVLAVVGRDLNEYPVRSDVAVLNTAVEVQAFLASESCPDTVFSKPAGGQAGAGVIIAHREQNQWRVDDQLLGGDELGARFFAAADGAHGRLLQPRIHNHPEIKALTGSDGLSTLRIMVARGKEDARVVFAIQKLIGPEADIDNFTRGQFGNCIAPVELETGSMQKCIGRKESNDYFFTRYASHPFTGARIEGTRLPLWEQVVDTVERGAWAYPHQPFVGFDLAITESGPVILEANSTWSWTLPQMTLQRGARPILLEVLNTLDLTEEERSKVRDFIQQRL